MSVFFTTRVNIKTETWALDIHLPKTYAKWVIEKLKQHVNCAWEAIGPSQVAVKISGVFSRKMVEEFLSETVKKVEALYAEVMSKRVSEDPLALKKVDPSSSHYPEIVKQAATAATRANKNPFTGATGAGYALKYVDATQLSSDDYVASIKKFLHVNPSAVQFIDFRCLSRKQAYEVLQSITKEKGHAFQYINFNEYKKRYFRNDEASFKEQYQNLSALALENDICAIQQIDPDLFPSHEAYKNIVMKQSRKLASSGWCRQIKPNKHDYSMLKAIVVEEVDSDIHPLYWINPFRLTLEQYKNLCTKAYEKSPQALAAIKQHKDWQSADLEAFLIKLLAKNSQGVQHIDFSKYSVEFFNQVCSDHKMSAQPEQIKNLHCFKNCSYSSQCTRSPLLQPYFKVCQKAFIKDPSAMRYVDEKVRARFLVHLADKKLFQREHLGLLKRYFPGLEYIDEIKTMLKKLEWLNVGESVRMGRYTLEKEE